MRNVIAVVLVILAMASTTQVLTFKKCEVLGGDGKTYEGASPEQLERLIERATASDIPAGVVCNNVFVVVGDKVSFVPTSELSGATKDTQLQIIGDQVVQDITGNENITFEQVEALNKAAEATGEDISSLFSEGGIEGLDAELVEELQQVASETGIDFENLLPLTLSLKPLQKFKLNS